MDNAIPVSLVSLDAVRYDVQTGLVPVIVQNASTRQVLMLAFANREALKRTFGTGEAWFWSRSRGDYWHKGATSGNVQRVVDVRLDCDGDSILYLVEPAGPACHTGEETCFYRTVQYGSTLGERSSDSDRSDSRGLPHHELDDVHVQPDAPHYSERAPQSNTDGRTQSQTPIGMHDDPSSTTILHDSALHHLWRTITDRYRSRPSGSYTTFLFEHGVDKIGKKVGEESVEVVIAAKNAVHGEAGRVELANESADLLFHLMTLWKASGITPDDVFRVLEERHK